MVKSTQLNIRLANNTIKSLKQKAKIKKMTISELLGELINQILSGEATNKDSKIAVLESENQELRARFEREFDKKIPRNHRISIALSDEQFMKIKELSSRSNISKSKVLSNILHSPQLKKQNLKALK